MLRQVAEGVLIHQSEFCQSNAVVVHGRAGVLLIDPGIYGSEMACLANDLCDAATEVARRAGHGVAVLLKIYAHCIDGQADAVNKRITDALGVQETQPESGPGDEGDDDSKQAS